MLCMTSVNAQRSVCNKQADPSWLRLLASLLASRVSLCCVYALHMYIHLVHCIIYILCMKVSIVSEQAYTKHTSKYIYTSSHDKLLCKLVSHTVVHTTNEHVHTCSNTWTTRVGQHWVHLASASYSLLTTISSTTTVPSVPLRLSYNFIDLSR